MHLRAPNHGFAVGILAFQLEALQDFPRPQGFRVRDLGLL